MFWRLNTDIKLAFFVPHCHSALPRAERPIVIAIGGSHSWAEQSLAVGLELKKRGALAMVTAKPIMAIKENILDIPLIIS